MFKNLKYIFNITKTSIFKLAFWEVLHGFFIAAPTGFLLIIIWELFKDNPNQQKIWIQVVTMIILFIVQLWVSRKAMVNTNVSIYTMTSKLRIMLGNHLQKLSLGFYKKKDPGDLAAVILQDVSNFETILSHSIQSIFGAIFGTFFLSLFLLYLDWKLALFLLLAIPAGFVFVFIAGLLSKKSNKTFIQSRNNTSSRFIEYIQGIRHLKAYNQTGASFKTLEHAFKKLKNDSIKMELIPGPFVTTTFVVLELFFLIMLYLAINRLHISDITIPVFVAFLIIGYRLFEPLKLLMVDYVILKYMNTSIIRIIDVLESPLQDNGKNLTPNTYNVEFKNVTFSYIDREILKGVSFSIQENGITALVGASGSGKSTIANLIARFWDIQKGQILIGGIDIKDIDPQTVYGMISEVFQDVYLFDDTIYNNIKIGKPTATKEEIMEVAEKSQVVEFLNLLSDGIETKVGEGGSHLSGGQKQRVSIARAMLKDAPILLLDEATASLDPENEIYIQQAILELVKDRTVVIIAHKLQTVKNANKIIVLENGKIKEEGKHQVLLDNKGLYSNYWNIQKSNSGWQLLSTKDVDKTKK